MALSPRLLKGSAFTPRSITGLALWLDASDSQSLFTTDAGAVTAVSAPTEIAGCVGWWDASDAATLFAADTGSTLATTTVGRWANKVSGGSDKDLLQTDSTKRPTITSNYIGGMQSLVFDGTNDALLRSFTLDATCHLFAVMKWPASYSANVRATDGYAQNTMSIVRTSNTAFTVYGSASLSLTGSGNALSPQIVEVCKNGTSSRLCINGAGQSFGNLSAEAPNGLTIGAYGLGTAAFDNVGFAEVIAFSDPLSVADAARVSAYLAAKWGISGVHAPATATSDPVGAWLDKSGNARHATQSTAGSRPTISATKQNGRNALAFNGSSQSLSIASYNAENGLTGLTRYIVASMSSGAATAIVRVWNGGGDTMLSTVSSELRFYAGGSAYSAVASPSYGMLTSGTNIIGSVYDGTAGSVAAGIKPYYNGSAISPSSTSGTLPTALSGGTPSFSIGSNLGVNSWWPGRIVEYISYSRALGNAERQRLERYLSAKYGIALLPQVSNADAQDWVNRVYANGGTVSSSTAAAVSTFCDAIDAASIRDRFYRMGIFAGSNLNAALVPLYRGPSLGGTQYGNTTDTNSGPFVVGDYSETLGLLGGGSKWLDTGFKPQTAGMTASSVHLSAVWPSFTHGASTNVFPVSMINAAVNERHWLNVNSNTVPNTEVGSLTGGSGSVSTNYQIAASNGGVTIPGGLWAVSRVSLSDARLFSGATQRAANTSTLSSSFGTENLSVYARWNGSTTFGHFSQRMMSYSTGIGMSDAQVAAFNTAITNFNTAMGRNV